MGRGRIVAVMLVAAVLGLAVAALIGNDFRYAQRSVTISGPDGRLEGVLTLPTDGRARGLVVMVHGDGPVDATQGGLYAPWFEGAADAGYATLSWSKPGIGGSEGDWLAQSMDDRAAEVAAVLDWARQQEDLPTGPVVLWGASQAGWVLPKVVANRDDVDAVVAVGPAINWLRQGRFNLLAELDHDGADAHERDVALATSDQTRELLEQGATHDEYRESSVDPEPMTAERWGFVLQNFRSDATADLRTASARDIPVQLIVGTHDRNVDADETQRAYALAFGSRLTVEHVDGAHSLARPVMEDVDAVGLATGIVWPRALLAPGAIDSYSQFLTTVAP